MGDSCSFVLKWARIAYGVVQSTLDEMNLSYDNFVECCHSVCVNMLSF